jgi:hypothetical protein
VVLIVSGASIAGIVAAAFVLLRARRRVETG